jgi:hypothetical protein
MSRAITVKKKTLEKQEELHNSLIINAYEYLFIILNIDGCGRRGL